MTCGTVIYQLECLASNVESMSSSLVRDNYCAGTLSKFFAYNTTTSVLTWRVNGSASAWCALRETLYKCIDTTQYIMHIRF